MTSNDNWAPRIGAIGLGVAAVAAIILHEHTAAEVALAALAGVTHFHRPDAVAVPDGTNTEQPAAVTLDDIAAHLLNNN